MHVDGSPEPRALLINGTVGAGKTSAAVAVGDLLTTRNLPHAVIDLDWLRQAWPAPQGDPFNFDLLLRNLRGIAANYLDAGAVRLVLAGVVEEQDERKQFASAVGVELSVCRLQVDLPVVHQRLARRHSDDPEALHWHLERSGELAGILDRAGVEDFTVDATTRSVAEVAEAVVEAAGWQ